VAVYPPPGDVQTVCNLTLRLDPPVGYVLLTDSNGQRLGHTPDGLEVNDFGARGVLMTMSSTNAPLRICSLTDPADGKWRVQVAGTETAPYTLRGYLADVSVGGTLASAAGTAQIGVPDQHQMVVTPPLGLTLSPVNINSYFDQDWDVDATDLGSFTACFSGPAVPWTGDCAKADLDNDADIDQTDFALFQRCYSGDGQAADLQCGYPWTLRRSLGFSRTPP
jgi:hypothetical protein